MEMSAESQPPHTPEGPLSPQKQLLSLDGDEELAALIIVSGMKSHEIDGSIRVIRNMDRIDRMGNAAISSQLLRPSNFED